MQGQLSEKQRAALQQVVRNRLRGMVQGRKVYDLGAGTCHLSRILLDLGASEVVAIDRHPKPDDLPYHQNLRYRQAYFHDLDPITDGVAFLSWPQQYIKEIVPVVAPADTIVYLGCNTDMSACGPDEFWEYVQGRELVAHIPSKRNTLLVYGGPQPEGHRELVLEERAGLDRSRIYSYSESYEV